jgi:hypothetical protein
MDASRGDRPRWNRGAGEGEGVLQKVRAGRMRREINRSIIARNGPDENPACLIRQDDRPEARERGAPAVSRALRPLSRRRAARNLRSRPAFGLVLSMGRTGVVMGFAKGDRVVWEEGRGVVRGSYGAEEDGARGSGPGARLDPLHRILRDDGQSVLRFASELTREDSVVPEA